MAAPPPVRLVDGEQRAAPRLGPPLELAALGIGLTLSITFLGRLPSWYHDIPAFQSLFALAFVFYALPLIRFKRYASLPHTGMVVLAVALATRAALLPVVPSLSGDLYRYVWEGRVIVAGGNPYRESPLDPRLLALRDREIFPNINHKELSTIYPPLAEAGFALVARISPTIGAFKLWVTLHDLLIVALLLLWARRRGTSEILVIAYAWNPLILVEYGGSGHNDPTALVWLAAAMMLMERRPVLSAVALAIGTLVKLVPLIALPFLFRRWPHRARWLAMVLITTGLAGYLIATRTHYSGLAAYWGTWRNNDLMFYLLDRSLGGFEGARWAALALVIVALAAAWRWGWSAWRSTRLGIRTGLLVSPVVHPWYLGWALAFEPLAPSAPWLLLSFTAILNYGVFANPAEGRNFHLPLIGRIVEYGLPFLLAIALAARRASSHPYVSGEGP